MEPKDNPFLQIEDPYTHVRNQKDEASKAQLELMQLCWTVFHQDGAGKRLMELLRERYLNAALYLPTHPQCKELALYWEGFREAIRGFYNLGLQHQQYVNGVNNNGRSPNASAGAT